MTEEEWLASDDFDRMYCRAVMPRKFSQRRMDLFCTACARLVCHLMDDRKARRAFEWLEAHPGQRERPVAGHVRDLFRGPARGLYHARQRDKGGVSGAAIHVAYDFWADWYEYAFPNLRAYGFVGSSDVLREDPQVYLPAVMRDLFPFGSVALDPDWRSPTVVQLATHIYDDQQFNLMPILADALEDARCTSHDVLQHCRSGHLHVRGCWLVDLLLANQ